MIIKRFGIYKRGNYLLSSGAKSNYYFDLKLLTIYPKLFSDVIDKLAKLYNNNFVDNLIIGVPSGAVSIAAALGYKLRIKTALYRGDKKKYGTGRTLEVEPHNKYNIVLIEDVVTTGKSVGRAAEDLIKMDHNIIGILCIFNRSRKTYVNVNGVRIKLISLYAADQLNIMKNFNNILGANIIYACDNNNYEDLKLVVPYICAIKIHSDILGAEMLRRVYEIAEQNNLRIIDDRKLGDIGAINRRKLINPADIVTAYATSLEAVNLIGCDVLLIYSLSIADLGAEYKQRCLKIAAESPYVVGLITQERVPQFKCFAPGIKFCRDQSSTDNMGQNYRYYKDVDADYYIAGRKLLEYVKKK